MKVKHCEYPTCEETKLNKWKMCSKHKVNYESITKKKFDLQYIQDGLKRIGKTKRKSLKPLKKVESGRVKTVQEALF